MEDISFSKNQLCGKAATRPLSIHHIQIVSASISLSGLSLSICLYVCLLCLSHSWYIFHIHVLATLFYHCKGEVPIEFIALMAKIQSASRFRHIVIDGTGLCLPANLGDLDPTITKLNIRGLKGVVVVEFFLPIWSFLPSIDHLDTCNYRAPICFAIFYTPH